MNRYCFVIKLKKEYIEEYREIHINAWPEMLKAINKAGAREELLYLYDNLSIVFFECEDLELLYKKLGDEEVVKKWDATIGPWIESVSPSLENIFDLNRQLANIVEE